MNQRLQFGLSLAAALTLTGLAQGLGAAEHEMTMTGCLESTGGGYALATADGKTELTGDADFAKHDGHTVKVTGAHTGTMMTVAKLEHVSPQCDASKMTAAGKTQAGAADEERARATGAKGPTAEDQGGNKADRETTAKIRKAIVDDDSFSAYAKNVKIITSEGKVTLRGPVRSTEEKAAVAAKAEAVLGDSVDNQLTVDPGKQK